MSSSDVLMWATGGVGLMLTYIKLRPQGKSVDDPVIERTATSEFSVSLRYPFVSS